MSTSTKSAASVQSLQEQLAALQQQIAALTSGSHAVSEAVVRRFTFENWLTIQSVMVVNGTIKGSGYAARVNGKVENGHFALVKKADVKTYMAVKGFANTLRAKALSGEPVELSAKLNDKGRSQVMYAQETIERLIEQGFIDRNAPILKANEPKARKSAKKS